jgi:hypothetical protein
MRSLQTTKIEEIIDIGLKAINDRDVLEDLADAVTQADDRELKDTLDRLNKVVVNNSNEYRAVKLLTSMIEHSLGIAKSGNIMPEIDYHDFQSIISAHNNFNMDGTNGMLGTYMTQKLGKNGGYSPEDISLSLFFYDDTPNYKHGKLTVTQNASGNCSKWEGTLVQFLDNGGTIRNRHCQSLIYPEFKSTYVDYDSRKITEEEVKVVHPPCTCGAVYFGAKDYGSSHSSYCERYKK